MASMRPGRARPGYQERCPPLPARQPRFNEAGARAPRILPEARYPCPPPRGFNEAGARAPRILPESATESTVEHRLQ